MDKQTVKLSKFLSLVLRHHPEKIGIELDEHGWADVEELIEGINRAGRTLDRAMLEEIVRENNKQRYAFDKTGTLIRANQGHSIPVDVELPECMPPEILWHGTGEKSAASIDRQGLKRMGRLYVHLSPDEQTALAVGRRHGRPVLYRVMAEKMAQDGYRFFRSVNGVWLTETVPTEYLEKG